MSKPWKGDLSLDLRKTPAIVKDAGIPLIDADGAAWAVVFADHRGLYDHASLIVEAVRAHSAVHAQHESGWLPFASAPKDGTPILCWHPDTEFSPITGIELVWWEGSESFWTQDGDNPIAFLAKPTHWRHLPPAPGSIGDSATRTPAEGEPPNAHNRLAARDKLIEVLEAENARLVSQVEDARVKAIAECARTVENHAREMRNNNLTLTADGVSAIARNLPQMAPIMLSGMPHPSTERQDG